MECGQTRLRVVSLKVWSPKDTPERDIAYVSFYFIKLLLSSYLVLRYNVNFAGMVLLGDELTVKLRHVSMREGNIVVNIETSNNRGEKVMQGLKLHNPQSSMSLLVRAHKSNLTTTLLPVPFGMHIC
jgi:hypothetical protein